MNITLLRTSVLGALAAGPLHGYGILQEIKATSNERLTPAVGSLYRVLDALSRDGLIEDDRTEVVDGRERRYYRLSPAGRAELVEAITAMESVTSSVRAQLTSLRKLALTKTVLT